MRGLWLHSRNGTRLSDPGGLAKSAGSAQASASSSRVWPVVIILGGGAATAPVLVRCLARHRDARAFAPGPGRAAVLLARTMPRIKRHQRHRRLASLAGTRDGGAARADPACVLRPGRLTGVITLLRGNCPASPRVHRPFDDSDIASSRLPMPAPSVP